MKFPKIQHSLVNQFWILAVVENGVIQIGHWFY